MSSGYVGQPEKEKKFALPSYYDKKVTSGIRTHALRRVSCSRTADGVISVTRARRNAHTICLLAIQRNWSTNRAGQVVVSISLRATKATGRGLCEMVSFAGLVIDNRDEASRAGTKGILRCSVGNAASGQWGNVSSSAVRSALHLV